MLFQRKMIVVRVLRLLGVLFWIVLGLAILAALFPFQDRQHQGRIASWWAGGLLTILGLHLEVSGDKPARRALVVANHVSWLDPFLLMAVFPVRFVAKAEIRHWPVMGWLAQRAGTVFIERERHRDVSRVANTFASHLQNGEIVGMFPESTTGDGSFLRPFKTSLFQVALAPGIECIPVGIRYSDAAAAWIDDMGFAESLWRIAGLSGLRAEVILTPALKTDGLDRRSVASLSEHAVAEALSLAVRHSPPAPPSGPPAATH